MTGRPGEFRNEAARARFFAAYEKALARWPEGREASDVATEFGTTRVHRHGSGARTPLVLLHGQNATSSIWAPNIARLAEERTVFAVDHVGEAGPGTQTRPIRTGEETSAWLEQVLEGLGLAEVHLGGFSYGAWIALTHTVLRPGRVVSLPLVEPPRALAPLPLEFVPGTLAVLLSGSERLQRRWFQRLAGPPQEEPADAEAQSEVGLQAMRTFRLRLPQPSRIDDAALAGIERPVLLFFGAESHAVDPKRAAARARSLLPDVRTEVVEGVGHGIPVARFNEAVPEFLREADAQKGGTWTG
ncbi:alpha/beta fold hydrolase [Streptomyces sulphureus]|uniref:alpha/beta fold hydrolase n=1 Tax=Streptomyces sulphureus TaxID=47758 RepID=UPI00035DF5E1|nr:alpha/beta fold hydrolase [Streptomyces sulphureus]